MTRFDALTRALLRLALILLALILAARAANAQPFDGFWRPGANGWWYPCQDIRPYTFFSQPDTGKSSYIRFDYQVQLTTTEPARLDQPTGQLSNHTLGYMTHDGRNIVVRHQSLDGGYFPYPTTAMLNPDWSADDAPYKSAGPYYAQENSDTGRYIVLSEAAYSAAIGGTSEWRSGDIFAAARAQQCSGLPPPKTATRTPTARPGAFTPTRAKTATPKPGQCCAAGQVCATLPPCSQLSRTVTRVPTRTATAPPSTPVPSATRTPTWTAASVPTATATKSPTVTPTHRKGGFMTGCATSNP